MFFTAGLDGIMCFYKIPDFKEGDEIDKDKVV
jgi:hypothetical protein